MAVRISNALRAAPEASFQTTHDEEMNLPFCDAARCLLGQSSSRWVRFDKLSVGIERSGSTLTEWKYSSDPLFGFESRDVSVQLN